MIEHNDHNLGYAGTLGWSGSSTSRERAEDEAESGVASARLSLALDLVSKAGPYGLTVRELRGLTEWHHGQASGALSNLHKNGDLARLHDQRGHCKIYVTHENVLGRLTERQGRPQATGLDLSPSDTACLVDARDRARALYGRASGSQTVWPDLPTYERFWRIISKIVDQG
jgi:hypothetical protein